MSKNIIDIDALKHLIRGCEQKLKITHNLKLKNDILETIQECKNIIKTQGSQSSLF